MHIRGIGLFGASVLGLFWVAGNTATATIFYWSGEGPNDAWNARASDGTTNWSPRPDMVLRTMSGIGHVPVGPDTAIFSMNGGGKKQTVTLPEPRPGEGMLVHDIVFNDQATKTMTLSNGKLQLEPTLGPNAEPGVGLEVTGGSAAHVIHSGVQLLNAQVWTIHAPTGGIDANALTVTGLVEGFGGRTFLKDGGGTLILTGNNTYPGGTVIQEGTIRVGNIRGSATGTGLLAVETAGTLAGTGRVGDMELHGTLSPGAPGAAVGKLTTGAQDWFDGARLQVDLGAMPDAGTMGVDWDEVFVVGTVDFQTHGQFTIDLRSVGVDGHAGALDGFDFSGQGSWPILSSSDGLLNFDPDRFTVDSSGFMNAPGAWFTVRADDNTLYLEYAPIPEPGVAGAIIGTALVLLRRRRPGRR